MIPKEFTIGGGRKIKVCIEEKGDNFGNWDDRECKINLFKNIDSGEVCEEDIERTFYHELIHCFQFFYNCEIDEAQAQTFSNFIYEYIHSRK